MTPKLRFKDNEGREFPGWVAVELQSICEINPKTAQLPETFVYVDLESVEKGVLLKQTVIAKKNAPSRAQRALKSEDVLFQMVRPYQGNNLFFNESGSFVASTGYAQIRTSEDPRFLYHYLHLEGFTAEVMNRCTGTSYPAINSSDLGSIEISFPSRQEQTKIANFLTAVDSKISQLTKKLELLTLYKKGVMQKIFNRELRFKDDDGQEFLEWEEKNLGNLCSITTGKLDANAMIENGEYRFYTCAKEYYRIDNYAFDTDALLVSGNGANVGYIHHYKGKFNAYQRTYVLDGFDENIIFIKYFLDTFLHIRIFKEAKEGNTPYIVMGTLTEMPIQLPTSEEQTKIANFLTAIDDKITNVKSQLEASKEYKQGLLQQMFV